MNDDRPADWLEFWVRFVCGAVAGAFVGASLESESFIPKAVAWTAWIGCPLVLGLAAAWLGDRFWHALLRLMR